MVALVRDPKDYMAYAVYGFGECPSARRRLQKGDGSSTGGKSGGSTGGGGGSPVCLAAFIDDQVDAAQGTGSGELSEGSFNRGFAAFNNGYAAAVGAENHGGPKVFLLSQVRAHAASPLRGATPPNLHAGGPTHPRLAQPPSTHAPTQAAGWEGGRQRGRGSSSGIPRKQRTRQAPQPPSARPPWRSRRASPTRPRPRRR